MIKGNDKPYCIRSAIKQMHDYKTNDICLWTNDICVWYIPTCKGMKLKTNGKVGILNNEGRHTK